MRRADRFLISQKPYAVDLGSLQAKRGEGPSGAYWDCSVHAVWFRRRRGVTVACFGRLWDYQRSEPENVREFLERHDDGRYGGDCLGRWDGAGYWGAQDLAVMQQHLQILQPMLENFPAVPPGFDGWWTFH